MGISYKQCSWVPTVDTNSLSFDRTEFCTSISDGTVSDGTRQCAGGSTPPLHSVEASFFSKEYKNAFNFDSEDGEITFDMAFWIGLEERPDNSLCLWVGQEEAGVCVNTCDVDADGQPDLGALQDIVDVFLDELDDFYSENDKWDLIATVGTAVAVAVIVALASAVSIEIAIAAGIGA